MKNYSAAASSAGASSVTTSSAGASSVTTSSVASSVSSVFSSSFPSFLASSLAGAADEAGAPPPSLLALSCANFKTSLPLSAATRLLTFPLQKFRQS